eukprot:3732438-Rhodomonas_salina.1
MPEGGTPAPRGARQEEASSGTRSEVSSDVLDRPLAGLQIEDEQSAAVLNLQDVQSHTALQNVSPVHLHTHPPVPQYAEQAKRKADVDSGDHASA